jgi:methylglutaconyl-CoA hydratase
MIRLEHRGPIALATLCRAEKRNALTPEMLRDLSDAASSLREAPPTGEKARALALTGDGPVFCAGFDLSLCRDDPQVMAALLTALSQACRALRRLPIPVVCAAAGAAVAGGCALASACDLVVTDEGARLGYPVVRLGVSPAVSGPMFAARVGWGRARERMLDPETVSGAEAVRIGLAHECVPTADAAKDRAIQMAQMFAQKPPHGLAATKRWLNELDGTDRDDVNDAALGASLALAGGAEERERLAAMWRR